MSGSVGLENQRMGERSHIVHRRIGGFKCITKGTLKNMATYQIDYFGIGGIEESASYTGGLTGLLVEATWIGERGGWGITATDIETDNIVYEDGGLVQVPENQHIPDA